ncbi:spherulation-specific family 4 protein [Streptacidiphilus sp. PB12-B1b]|uniref:spherulation-specific family 4 protein n=1 Tax=Streptacidiphilus sp. PB12-B1b TaxID=2705012 RepID=UPI001CDCEDEC|nr:spherulation-specific family 4 protein [Streptacidiphilus sp. PB12-B1b]
MTTHEAAGRRLLVPLYAYPGTEPEPWAMVEAHADSLAGVVLNPHSGPGPEPEPEFAAVAARLRSAGVPLLGYVDSDYGRRHHREVVADIARHRDWYGVDGVFLDQAASGLDSLPHYRRLAVAARSLDAAAVVFNPGVHPHPGFAEVADLVITFEGEWEQYRALRTPPWTESFPAQRFGHLVHGTPAALCSAVAELARLRHAAVSYATPGTGANPWGVLMPQLCAPAPARDRC